MPPGIFINGENTAVGAWLGQRVCDQGIGRDVYVINQGEMTQNARTCANRAIGTDGCAASHACTSCHGGVFAHPHVVPDLNQVVQNDPVFYDRVFHGTRRVDIGVEKP